MGWFAITDSIRSKLSLGSILVAVLFLHFCRANSQSIAVEKPNIILVNVDDADYDLIRFGIKLEKTETEAKLPNIRKLAIEGIEFTNFHVTTPLCGPSRSCLLR